MKKIESEVEGIQKKIECAREETERVAEANTETISGLVKRRQEEVMEKTGSMCGVLEQSMREQVKEELNKLQGEMISSLKQELAATKIQEEPKPPKSGREELENKSYLNLARRSQKRYDSTNRGRERMKAASLSDFGRSAEAT